MVHDAWQHHLGAPWREGHFGPVYGALVAGAMAVVEGIGRFAGYPPEWSFALIGVTAGGVGALLGTATIPAAYLLGARAYGPGAGLVGAALVAVSPLHTFHSHYPYRDVPMVLGLTLALAGCVGWLGAPRLRWLALGGLGAASAAALKTTGFTILLPLVATAWLGRRRLSRWATGVALGTGLAALLLGVRLGGIPTLPGGRTPALDSPLGVGLGLVRFVGEYLVAFAGNLGAGTPVALALLARWLGPAVLAASLAAVGWALVRRRPADLVLLALLVPAFLVAAMFRWLDERYLVPLVPVAAVLVGRLAADAWTAARGRALGRLGAAAGVTVLIGGGLLQSGWQGVLLTLPDTRALAGGWLGAHVPRETPLLAEPYAPLGLDVWPTVLPLDPTHPVARELARGPLLVTSSLEHQRYLDAPTRYPREAAFFRALPAEARLVKEIALGPLGFVHPTIAVYATDPRLAAPVAPRVPLPVPRPFDHGWNGGVAFVARGPYDRDDRTVALGGGQAHAVTLASAAPVGPVAVFAANGPEPAELRVRVGGRTRRRALAPGDLAVLRFEPAWRWPLRPALYRVEIGLRPEGAAALVQVRVGAREIGETHAAWGRWVEAIAALRGVVAVDPADLPARLLLARALRETGRAAEARAVASGWPPAGRAVLDAYRRLGDAPDEGWDDLFARLTGLEPALLRRALAVELEAEALREAGWVVGDPGAGGGLALQAPPGPDPALVLNGPGRLHLPPGAYRAVFVLRGPREPAEGSRAVLRVFAETARLASRAVTGRDLAPAGGGSPGFVEVALPFRHTRPAERVAVQVEATGAGPVTVDRVRIEPDLRAAIRDAIETLAALAP